MGREKNYCTLLSLEVEVFVTKIKRKAIVLRTLYTTSDMDQNDIFLSDISTMSVFQSFAPNNQSVSGGEAGNAACEKPPAVALLRAPALCPVPQ